MGFFHTCKNGDDYIQFKFEERSSIFGMMNTSWPIAGALSTLVRGYMIESMNWNQVFMVGAAVNAISIITGFRIETSNHLENQSSHNNL